MSIRPPSPLRSLAGRVKSLFISRTPRGRCVTRKAYEHLGVAYMGQQQISSFEF